MLEPNRTQSCDCKHFNMKVITMATAAAFWELGLLMVRYPLWLNGLRLLYIVSVFWIACSAQSFPSN